MNRPTMTMGTGGSTGRQRQEYEPGAADDAAADDGAADPGFLTRSR